MPQNAQIDALAALAQRIYGELGRTLTLAALAAPLIPVIVRRCVQADARWLESRRRRCPHRPRVCRGGQHGAAILSVNADGVNLAEAMSVPPENLPNFRSMGGNRRLR